MKKMMLAVMAAMVIGFTGTAMAATPATCVRSVCPVERSCPTDVLCVGDAVTNRVKHTYWYGEWEVFFPRALRAVEPLI